MRPMRSGRATISMSRPRALGECDRCSEWRNLDYLFHQMQWTGNVLTDTGLLVCDDCLDVPQPQFKTPILPPDPYPRINPRPSPNTTPLAYLGAPLPTSPDSQGFTVFILGITLGSGIFTLDSSVLDGPDVLA